MIMIALKAGRTDCHATFICQQCIKYEGSRHEEAGETLAEVMELPCWRVCVPTAKMPTMYSKVPAADW